jgi:transposase
VPLDADRHAVIGQTTKFAIYPSGLIGIEARATAHPWARILKRMGHQVRLIPPAYVKPCVKPQKNDEVDAVDYLSTPRQPFA